MLTAGVVGNRKEMQGGGGGTVFVSSEQRLSCSFPETKVLPYKFIKSS